MKAGSRHVRSAFGATFSHAVVAHAHSDATMAAFTCTSTNTAHDLGAKIHPTGEKFGLRSVARAYEISYVASMTHIKFYKAEVLGQVLRRRGWRVSCAESCTGGGIAEAITAVAGSSEWFDLGLVTYSNQMKSKLLGVPEGELLEHGAVSQVVVESMLRGALTLSGANIAVAVSGVAGPGGGSPEKPVGTVFVAWGALGDIRSERLQLEGDRASIRSQTVEFGLNKLNEFCDTEE